MARNQVLESLRVKRRRERERDYRLASYVASQTDLGSLSTSAATSELRLPVAARLGLRSDTNLASGDISLKAAGRTLSEGALTADIAGQGEWVELGAPVVLATSAGATTPANVELVYFDGHGIAHAVATVTLTG